jgi:hypothetical protein
MEWFKVGDQEVERGAGEGQAGKESAEGTSGQLTSRYLER